MLSAHTDAYQLISTVTRVCVLITNQLTKLPILSKSESYAWENASNHNTEQGRPKHPLPPAPPPPKFYCHTTSKYWQNFSHQNQKAIHKLITKVFNLQSSTEISETSSFETLNRTTTPSNAVRASSSSWCSSGIQLYSHSFLFTGGGIKRITSI